MESAWEPMPECEHAVRAARGPPWIICGEHGVIVEQIPWSEGKRPVATGDEGSGRITTSCTTRSRVVTSLIL